MKIKDVEKRTGITSYNIRFYEKENLLIPKRNPVNGYREYTEEDILLLNRIKMLRMLDIPVSDIRKILYEKEALTSVLITCAMNQAKIARSKVRFPVKKPV